MNIFILFILQISVCFCARFFYKSELCQKSISDCSFQFNYKSSCQVYDTSICEKMNFSEWNLGNVDYLSPEINAPLSVTVIPYVFQVFEEVEPESAINITISVLNKDVVGFSIYLLEDKIPRNICRIFHFRNSTYKTPINLYYDCFHRLVKSGLKNAKLLLIAYPMDWKVSYIMFIPPHVAIDSAKACHWKPLLLLSEESLLNYFVQLKFSTAPEHLNVLYYSISLLDFHGNEIQNMQVSPHQKDGMETVEFFSVGTGYYSINIDIKVSDITYCTVFRTQNFIVGDLSTNYTFISFVVLLIVMIILMVLLFYLSFKWVIKPKLNSPNPVLLLVYSFDCQQHQEFIDAFISYLQKCYNLNINTIYGTCGSPFEWLKEKYCESNAVVFLISEGLYHTIEKNNKPKLKEGHHWINQLAVAEAFVSSEKEYYTKNKNKKICKICFPYSGKHHIPKVLRCGMGPLFMLPSDMNDFLCYIFDCTYRVPFVKHISKLTHFFEISNHEEKSFKDRLEIMKSTVIKKEHVHFINTEIKSVNNVLNHSKVKSDKLSEQSEFQNDDSLKLMDSSKNKLASCETYDGMTNFKSGDILGTLIRNDYIASEVPKKEQCHEQTTLLSTDNDDFLTSCIKKEFS